MFWRCQESRDTPRTWPRVGPSRRLPRSLAGGRPSLRAMAGSPPADSSDSGRLDCEPVEGTDPPTSSRVSEPPARGEWPTRSEASCPSARPPRRAPAPAHPVAPAPTPPRTRRRRGARACSPRVAPETPDPTIHLPWPSLSEGCRLSAPDPIGVEATRVCPGSPAVGATVDDRRPGAGNREIGSTASGTRRGFVPSPGE